MKEEGRGGGREWEEELGGHQSKTRDYQKKRDYYRRWGGVGDWDRGSAVSVQDK